MKNKFTIILLIFLSFFIFNIKVFAENNSVINGSLIILDSKSDCEYIVDGVIKEDLENIFKAFKIAGPILVIGISSYDYLMAIFSKDAEGLKKANKKLIRRGILVVILFFLPDLINLLLGIVDSGTCIE